MAETYCGKTCADCEYKETLSCSGCRGGPGKQYGGDCPVAKCCREKGHQQCSTCGFSENCNPFRGKNRMPEYRLKAIEAEKIRTAEMARRASILGPWLWVLFWLCVLSSIGSLVTSAGTAGAIPAITISGYVFSAICSFIYGIIHICLGSEEERYRKSGVCVLIGGAISAVAQFIPGVSEDILWILMLSFATVVVSLIGEYSAFTAHSIVITGLDNKQAEKWSMLLKWYFSLVAAALGGIALYFLVPFLGVLVMILACISLCVVDILKLVYLYRTAKRFREYTVDGCEQIASR